MGTSNPTTYLSDRLAALRKAQNPDGGWAYYAGKNSWLEPTVYAALALDGQPEADRAWILIQGWQLPSGGWRPSAEVTGPNWTTALAVVLASKLGQRGEAEKGLEWLANNKVEGAWPWRRASLPAAEPTALALLALRHAGEPVAKRAQEFLLEDRLSPETCGPALLGLQGLAEAQPLAPLAVRWAEETLSPLTRAWIHLGLRANGWPVPEPVAAPLPRNLALTALQALAHSAGNHQLLRLTGREKKV